MDTKKEIKINTIMENGELKKAYEAIEMLKALELPVSNEQMIKIYELEETYIKEEIIPIIKSGIEPLVKDMMGNFHLDVSYSKDDGLKVQNIKNHKTHENSRGRRIVTETPRKSEKPKTEGAQLDGLNTVFGTKKKQASKLKVFREDDSVIEEATSALTFCETIKEIGAEKVYNLFIPLDGNYLVMKTKNSDVRSDMHYVGDGYYVNTHSNTMTKKRHLERIFHELNLNWKIEIV